jgi:DNA (cytosine-5)-methyltransferase 1
MAAYYNEHDPFAAAWLRELIKAGHIAPGDVDERSIEDVLPIELAGYTQCHFFAGIGVWSYALRRAGWPDDRPVWTGSCPCQPFSAAGKGGGFADERHLWPAWFHLISVCKPSIVFGEQVASKDGLAWFDLVHADLEAAGYAIGAGDLCAAGVGAPHIRQRLWFVAMELAALDGRQQWRAEPGEWSVECGRGSGGVADAMRGRAGYDAGKGVGTETTADGSDRDLPGQRLRLGVEGASGGLADTDDTGSQGRDREHADPGGRQEATRHSGSRGAAGRLADANGGDAGTEGLQRGGEHGQQPEDGGVVWVADSVIAERPNRQPGERDFDAARGRDEGATAVAGLRGNSRPGPTNGHWRDADWLHCRDGKWRPVEPGTFPLAHGAPARVGRLRGYGNAINAEAAQAFIESVM